MLNLSYECFFVYSRRDNWNRVHKTYRSRRITRLQLFTVCRIFGFLSFLQIPRYRLLQIPSRVCCIHKIYKPREKCSKRKQGDAMGWFIYSQKHWKLSEHGVHIVKSHVFTGQILFPWLGLTSQNVPDWKCMEMWSPKTFNMCL